MPTSLSSPKGGQLATYEPLLDDDRVGRIEERLRKRFRVPEKTTFVSFIQPAVERGEDLIPPVAVFAVISPNPRYPGKDLMNSAAVWLETWEEDERVRSHFVGVPDPAYPIYARVLREHLPIIENLRDMI